MQWIPSFVKLFLFFVTGLVLSTGGGIAEMESLGNYTMSSIFGALRLVGLLLMVVSPLLMALKFFAQLDRKAK
ncbi:hypothetical protein DDQ68_10130 [Hymenobacter nivis]|uniref:Uncharacterized protein n=1 Tax=Hymenobacter nivis TaxID=1850093 RepID=A0A2Z3GL66_9BACT|nr:hypothetical protein DDQ68_10130 [Hymenobacter nivis]